jgi:hypothetical protein
MVLFAVFFTALFFFIMAWQTIASILEEGEK